MTKIVFELEEEQVDAIVNDQLKEAKGYLENALKENLSGEAYYRVYFSDLEDPDGSKDRVALQDMVKSFNAVLEYFGVKDEQ